MCSHQLALYSILEASGRARGQLGLKVAVEGAQPLQVGAMRSCQRRPRSRKPPARAAEQPNVAKLEEAPVPRIPHLLAYSALAGIRRWQNACTIKRD